MAVSDKLFVKINNSNQNVNSEESNGECDIENVSDSEIDAINETILLNTTINEEKNFTFLTKMLIIRIILNL